MTPGVVSSLCSVDDEAAKAPLKPDEVEIKALAFALDEAGVDPMTGRSGNSSSIGECAGFITALGSDWAHSFQIGERVCCWNTSVAFASQTRVKGSSVQRMPKSWSGKTDAALPQDILLAYYGLRDCAPVESGQTVLIHGARGPLGQALAVVASVLGLQVVATVKNRAENDTLVSLVLLTDEDALVDVRETVAPTNALADV